MLTTHELPFTVRMTDDNGDLPLLPEDMSADD